jgi:2OG-Fe(II) oxygenase superfamily
VRIEAFEVRRAGNRRIPDEPAGYSGGSLVFYGLMGESSGKTVGLPLAGETGMLIAFPSDLVHAVSPVTAGERYTIVSWFYPARTSIASFGGFAETADDGSPEPVRAPVYSAEATRSRT